MDGSFEDKQERKLEKFIDKYLQMVPEWSYDVINERKHDYIVSMINKLHPLLVRPLV